MANLNAINGPSWVGDRNAVVCIEPTILTSSREHLKLPAILAQADISAIPAAKRSIGIGLPVPHAARAVQRRRSQSCPIGVPGDMIDVIFMPFEDRDLPS